ncbi:MAG: HigA family addiction module antitoxin [Gammaproteobacteria bacterium]
MSTTISVNRRLKRPPTHPGAVLREDVLPDLGLTVSAFARSLGVSRQTIHKLLIEKQGVSAEMALRLGKFLGNGPLLWLRMQEAYDLWHAEKALSKPLSKMARYKAA